MSADGMSDPGDANRATRLGSRSTIALVRLGSMTAQLLEELKVVRPVDARSCRRMRDSHNHTVAELRGFLPGDLGATGAEHEGDADGAGWRSPGRYRRRPVRPESNDCQNLTGRESTDPWPDGT